MDGRAGWLQSLGLSIVMLGDWGGHFSHSLSFRKNILPDSRVFWTLHFLSCYFHIYFAFDPGNIQLLGNKDIDGCLRAMLTQVTDSI